MIPIYFSAVANHLWQSTLFGGAAVLLAALLRRNRAHWRYSLWMAASIKFLIPFSLLLALGAQFAWHAARPALQPVPAQLEQIGQPFAAPIFTPQAPAGAPIQSALPVLLFLVWLGGAAAVASRWWVRWRRVRAVLRTATPLPLGGPVPVMSSSTQLEPGIFGVFRPVLLLPEGLEQRLTPSQFDAILAHEFCHVRRRDNQAAALHMAVEAIFWFHPLVWWIGGRLVEERERACDEAVLRAGSDPEAYAAGILTVCKFYLESPLACASGVTGADLKKRIEAIMSKRSLHHLSLTKKLILAVAAAAAVAGPIVIGMSTGRAQERLRYEVATIKPIKASGGRGGMQLQPGGRINLSGATVKMLIAMAYDLRETQISGGPAWASSDAFEIVAKPEPPDTTGGNRQPAPGTEGWRHFEMRLQSLLAERFHLVVHKESKQGAIYALVLAKGGSKLEPSKLPEDVPPGTMRSRDSITGRAGTTHMLAALLSNWLRRPVEDRTGLTGRYDYKVEYAPDPNPAETSEEAGVHATLGASIFTALQEQLGLKLEAVKGAIDTIVIDRVDKPTAN